MKATVSGVFEYPRNCTLVKPLTYIQWLWLAQKYSCEKKSLDLFPPIHPLIDGDRHKKNERNCWMKKTNEFWWKKNWNSISRPIFSVTVTITDEHKLQTLYRNNPYVTVTALSVYHPYLKKHSSSWRAFLVKWMTNWNCRTHTVREWIYNRHKLPSTFFTFPHSYIMGTT